MLADIEDHFASEYPREGCGVFVIKQGKKHWIPCTNVAKDDEEFQISSSEYIKLRRKFDIIGIVHSHPNSPATPSEYDINCCNALGINYYIFSYPGMELYKLEPERQDKPLIGREYHFGTSDCFEVVRDYYIEKGINLPKRDCYEDDWWLKGLDYFTKDYIAEWGFLPVNTAEPGDLLIFAIGSTIANHCGVYLGNEIFLHHAHKRLSCRESINSHWGKGLVGIYRYEA